MKRRLALAGWLAFIATSIAVLHRLGQWFPLDLIVDPGGPLEPTLAASLRLLGLAVGYWLAASTLLYLVGRATRIPAAVRAVRWMTIGPVKRLVDGMVAGALVAAIGLPAGVGAMTEPGYVPVPAGDPPAGDQIGPVFPVEDVQVERGQVESSLLDPGSVVPGTLFLPMQPVANPPTADPDKDTPPALVSAGPTEVVVRPGDHMWSMAEQKLALVRGRAVSDSEIALYWLKVVGTNLSRIRSGDPDLAFPGEVLVLPPVDP